MSTSSAQDLESLLNDLSSGDPARRLAAAGAMGRLDPPDPRAIAALDHLLLLETDDSVAAEARSARESLQARAPDGTLTAAESAPPVQPADRGRGVTTRDLAIGFFGWLVVIGGITLVAWPPASDTSYSALSTRMYCLTPLLFGLNGVLLLVALFQVKKHPGRVLGVLAALAANLLIGLATGVSQLVVCGVPFLVK